MIDVNLTGHFFVSKQIVRLILKAGGGNVVNTCSTA
tara:strand:+ start:646 stop:753 length:108 start_codon:yes stop_codon:yes gene_type:complete